MKNQESAVQGVRRATAVAAAAAVGLAAVLALPAAHSAQPDYPNKPIRLVVPFPPGGAADALARALGQSLQEKMGAQVVVENKAGAGGTIGTAFVAKAPADGYTLLLGNVSTLAIAPSLYPNLQYKPETDFKAVSMVGNSPLVYVVNPRLPVKNLPELMALAKKEPGRISFGSSGAGSITHLTGELLNMASGNSMVHVPYKGSAPVLMAVASGELQMGVTQVVEMLPQYKSGRVKAVGITGLKKTPPAPELETAAAQGIRNLHATTWYGIFAPADVPDDIVKKLNTGIAAGLNDAALKSRYAADGLILESSSPDAMKKFMQEEVAAWARVVKDANVKLD